MKAFEEVGLRQTRNVDKLVVSMMTDLKQINSEERAAIIGCVIERLVAGTIPAIGRLTMPGLLSAIIYKIHTSGLQVLMQAKEKK